nr:antibiotic biosynthesis monooxygenase family protein [uncultured Albidiferax sp.]
MLIVSGYLLIQPGMRDQFLACCEPSIRLARNAPGCLDFAVSADTIEPDRANVYEAWVDAKSLAAFRESGSGDPSFAYIVGAEVARHEVSQSGPP